MVPNSLALKYSPVILQSNLKYDRFRFLVVSNIAVSALVTI